MKIFWRFFKYLKPYLKPLVIANVFMLLFVLFSLLSIGLIMPFIDLLFNQSAQTFVPQADISILDLKDFLTYKLSELVSQYNKIDLVTYLCILMIIVFFFKNLFSYLQTYSMSLVEQGMIRDIRLDLYTHFHKLYLVISQKKKKGS